MSKNLTVQEKQAMQEAIEKYGTHSFGMTVEGKAAQPEPVKGKTLFERVIFGEFTTEMTNEADISIQALDNKAVRDPYFITWLHRLAKHDLYNATVNDDFFDSITHRPGDGKYVYGYHIDGKIEGIIEVVELGDDRCKIFWFYVNKKKHNLGIGQNLFNFVLNKYGDKTLELDVKAKNEKAIYIYEKYGFKITGAFGMFLNGAIADVYTMERKPGLLESVEVFFMDNLFCE